MYITVMFPSAERSISTGGWARQLSSRSSAFSSSRRSRKCRLTDGTNDFLNHSVKMAAVIHAFPLAVYARDMVSMFAWWKQQGFADFPMHNGFSLCVPVLLTQNNTVVRSFASLYPSALRASFFMASVRSGSILKNNPVSSAL